MSIYASALYCLVLKSCEAAESTRDTPRINIHSAMSLRYNVERVLFHRMSPLRAVIATVQCLVCPSPEPGTTIESEICRRAIC